MNGPTILADLVQDPNGPPCWARSATGVLVAAVLWLGFLGARATMRRYRAGDVAAARLTGAGVAAGVIVGFVAVWLLFSLAF